MNGVGWVRFANGHVVCFTSMTEAKLDELEQEHGDIVFLEYVNRRTL